MKIIWRILFLLSVVLHGRTYAQDPQFTQYFATPLYLNPAFTGANPMHRMILNYRNQWPAAVNNGFVSYVFSYDYNWEAMNSGIGFFAIQDRAGDAALTYRNVGALYSYEAKLTRDWSLRGGFHVSFTQKDIDYSRLLFNDQIYRGGGPSFDASSYFNVTYLDYAAGLLMYSENAFVGVAMHHLTEPNESFLDLESIVPRKLSIHGGYSFNLRSIRAVKSIIPSFNYKIQGNFDQLDVGIYYNHEPLVMGIWYRGIPVSAFRSNGLINNDALAILLGYALEDVPLRVGYSYDITTSGLFRKSGGSHEISLIYEFGRGGNSGSNSNYNKRPIPCSKF